jgi:DNA-binding PadR family transcriptional regulator
MAVRVLTSRVEVAVLACLAEGSMHGYELLERMRSRSMALWADVAKASVYQALQRLERQSMIAGRDQEGTEGPDRRVYRITKVGRSHLKAGLIGRFGTEDAYETDAGLALGFVHLLPEADARRALQTRERALHHLVDAAQEERDSSGSDTSVGRTVANAMLDRQSSLAEAELRWIKGFRASLVKLGRQPTVG